MSGQSPEVEVLIIRYLTDTVTPESKEKLIGWLAESWENKRHFNAVRSIWNERSSDLKPINADEVLEHVWREGLNLQQTKVVRSKWKFNHWFKIAAVITLVFATLFVVYFLGDRPPVYVIRENPAGQRSRFDLPDGSIVWLNSQSSLRYLENFSSSERKIELTGEAFFYVKKDSLRPFIVLSGELSATALGTSFNVSAYADKDAIEVTLISGRLNVQDMKNKNESVMLEPGMMARYDSGRKLIVQNKADYDKVLAWKSGILIFDGDNFTEFKRKIELWYDVTVIVNGNVPDSWNIRGRFDNEYLPNILNIVRFNKEFNYKIDNKQVTLNFKTNATDQTH